jgi:alanine racemase
MFSFLKKKSYTYLNKIVISRDAVHANHNSLQKLHTGALVCPVLKSNAYGHGLKVVAPIFDAMNCPFLIVDSLYEAYELHKLKVKSPILIMGYTPPANFKVKKVPFHITVFDLELAKTLNTFQPNCNVHIFIDTGMNREGIPINELSNFLSEIKKLKKINVVGLCSHFSDADNPSSLNYTKHQITQFKKGLKIMEENGFSPRWKHISTSSGAFKIHDKTFNMMRVGLAHYGINPLENKDNSANNISLIPALEFHSTLIQIKNIPKGASVGYGCTYTSSENRVLGVISAGYYEGVDRRLSNKGFVKIRGKFFPFVGRISMNMSVVDITNLHDPEIGETLIIYSSNPTDKNSLVNAAKTTKTISYDLMIHLAESIRRIVI